jgi:hypothetical protein
VARPSFVYAFSSVAQVGRADAFLHGLMVLLVVPLGAVCTYGFGPHLLVGIAATGAAYAALRALRLVHPWTALGVLCAPTILGLPLLISRSSIAIVAVFALGAFLRLWRSDLRLPPHALWVGLFPALILIACARSEEWGMLGLWASFLAFAVVAVLTAKEDELSQLKLATLLSPVLYVLVNLGLAAAGVGRERGFEGGPAEILSALGLAAYRQVYPLASGYGDFGGAAALGLVGTVMLQRGHPSSRQRVALALASAVCGWGLLTVDTRGAVFAGLAAVAVVALCARVLRQWIAVVAMAIPFSSAIVTASIYTATRSQAILDLGRPGTDELSGRAFIWERITDRLRDVSMGDVFGYGLFGPYHEGISERYFVALPSTTDAIHGTAHNFAFQTIFDTGYLGLATAVAVFAFTLARFGTDAWRIPMSSALLAMTLFMVLTGATDTTPTIYTPQVFAIWVVIVLLALKHDAAAEPLEAPSDGRH